MGRQAWRGKKMLKFIRAYLEWKKIHRQEVQEEILRKEALKTPLNYQLLEQLFQAFTNTQKDAVLEVEGKDCKIKLYWDDKGQVRRLTTTEQILNQYNGITN
jgi:hypothetical protein